MDNLLSLIGTIASVGSVPLSFFLYIKSRENKVDKVKRDVVRILSHQIGEQRELTTFEIQTVINSKSRESKISIYKITVDEIIEDLVSDTISNPLLEKTIKETIITELKAIYFKGEMLETIDNIEKESRIYGNEEKLEIKIKELLVKRKFTEEQDKLIKENSKKKRLSESFALIGTVTTLLAAIFTIVGKKQYDQKISKPLYDFLENNDFYIAILTSIIVAVISSGLLVLTRKIKKN